MMAQAYPDFDAGAGDMLSQQGSSSEWLYHVEVDDEGDEPWPVLFAVAGPGTPHPVARFQGLRVSGYRMDTRVNERWYRIVVIYSPLSDETYGIWRRSGQIGSETRQLTRSLASYPAEGQFPTPGDDTAIDQSIPVGWSKYLVANTEGTGAWQNKYRSFDGAIKLNRADGINPSGGGIEVNEGILSLGYEITTVQLSINKIKSLQSFAWSTNSGSWPRRTTRGSGGAYDAWTLIFSGMRFDDLIINLTGVGPYWFSHVSVELLYKPLSSFLNPFGWRGVSREEYADDGSGHNIPVFENIPGGTTFRQSVKNYVTYPDADFYGLFGLLGSNPVL